MAEFGEPESESSAVCHTSVRANQNKSKSNYNTPKNNGGGPPLKTTSQSNYTTPKKNRNNPKKGQGTPDEKLKSLVNTPPGDHRKINMPEIRIPQETPPHDWDMRITDYHESMISLWWDLENCHISRKFKLEPADVVGNICFALGKMNYTGSMEIYAYADMVTVPRKTQEALLSTGTQLINVTGKKDSADKRMLVDMMAWTTNHPPPATYFLLSGDADFSYILHVLGRKKYNILLAQPHGADSKSPKRIASHIWLWESLMCGGAPLPPSPPPLPRLVNEITQALTTLQFESMHCNRKNVISCLVFLQKSVKLSEWNEASICLDVLVNECFIKKVGEEYSSWNCTGSQGIVDPDGAQFTEHVYSEVLRYYILSSDGKNVLSNMACMFQATICLRDKLFPDQKLGKVYEALQQMIKENSIAHEDLTSSWLF